MIAFFGVLSAIFVIWRGVLVIPGRRIVLKIILSLLVILAAFKFQILHFFGGAMYFAPELPRSVLLGGAVVYSIHFIFFLLLLASEIIRLLLRCVYGIRNRKLPEKFSKINLWINCGLLALAFIVSGIGIVSGTSLPEVRKVEIEIKDLPASADDLKIAFLTDLHVDRMSDPETLSRIVEKVNALKPDLILLGGDLMDGKAENMKNMLLPLRELRAKYGVFGVPGNHEYYSGFVPWMEFLEKECKITMLINASHRLPCGITLAGVGDYAGKRFKLPTVDLRQTFKDIAVDEPVILLAHRPDLAREAEKMQVIHQLSGHTHGGMLPGLSWIVKRLNGNFVSGKYTIGKTVLYVSNGTGIWSGFPVRLGVPSEITLIELERD